MPILDAWKDKRPIVIGTIHVPPLPASPRCAEDWDSVRRFTLDDAERLVEGGVDGLLLENFGDAPFFPRHVPRHTVAFMTTLASAIGERYDVPFGVNVLRNDGASALAISAATGGAFIRVNVLCGARVTDQGVIEGIAHELLRQRRELKASVKILADVDVKHSAALANRPLPDETTDLIQRGGADAIIVSGPATGKQADVDQLAIVKTAAGDTPVLVGSGATAENISVLKAHADGFIIGTSFKCDGVTTNPVDIARVRSLIQQIDR